MDSAGGFPGFGEFDDLDGPSFPAPPGSGPAEVVTNIVRPGTALSLCVYTHNPEEGYEGLDDREVRTVPAPIPTQVIRSLISSACAVNGEVGLNSNYTFADEVQHIAMIDFVAEPDETGTLSPEYVDTIRKQLSQFHFDGPLYLFRTARSFHAYIPAVLNHTDWIKYMGCLLLCNRPDRGIVDTRWVGYALRRGYSTLRWTALTGRHPHEPKFVRSYEM